MDRYAEYASQGLFEAVQDCANFGLLICGVCSSCKAAKDQSRLEAEVMRDSDACREAFEEWYSDGWEYPRAVERDGEGYKLLGAEYAWAAWDAAWRAAMARVNQGAI